MADDAPARTAADEAPAIATPRSNITTGKSKMSSFGATLAANFTIVQNENGPTYPVLAHHLNTTAMFNMFARIIFQICLSINRELGAPNVVNDLPVIRDITNSVAWDALSAAYVVMYNKGRRFDYGLFANMPVPPILATKFPIFVSALINSIGPIQRDDVPSRRIHVPYITYNDVNNNRPAGYASHLAARFVEKFGKTKLLSGIVESNGSESSGWWTIHPLFLRRSMVPDQLVPNAPNYPELALYSPFGYDNVENYLKLAPLYSVEPLAFPGVGPYSVTDWYTRDQLNNFQGTWPNESDFPLESRNYPYLWTGTAAYYSRIERRITRHPDEDDAQDDRPSSSRAASKRPVSERIAQARYNLRSVTPLHTSTCPTLREANQLLYTIERRIHTDVQQKRTRTETTAAPEISQDYRPTSPNLEMLVAEDTTTTEFRMVYFYFDHIAITNATPYEYNHWITELVSAQ